MGKCTPKGFFGTGRVAQKAAEKRMCTLEVTDVGKDERRYLSRKKWKGGDGNCKAELHKEVIRE